MTLSPAKITAILTARPGKAEELEALLVSMAPHCRAEPGNLCWDVWRDTSNPDRYIIDELYRDAAAVEAHRGTPHFQAYLGKVPDLAERMSVVSKPVDIK